MRIEGKKTKKRRREEKRREEKEEKGEIGVDRENKPDLIGIKRETKLEREMVTLASSRQL